MAIAAACGWPIALAGVIGFALRGLAPVDADAGLTGLFGYLYLPGIVLVGSAGLIAAPLGVRWARSLGSDRLGRVFGVMLLLVAVRMALQ